MYYINAQPNEAGNHGNPVSRPSEGMVELPDVILPRYIATKGFAILEIDDGTVMDVEINQEAYDAYMADHPDVPGDPEPTAEELVNIMLGATEESGEVSEDE